MKKMIKAVSFVVSLGGKVVNICSKCTDAVDHVIHRKEYLKAQKRATVFRVMLCVAGGVLAVLFFPYRVIVEKNGDFEIRSLLMRVSRRTQPYQLPEGGEENFDICAEDDTADCEVVESVAETEA